MDIKNIIFILKILPCIISLYSLKKSRSFLHCVKYEKYKLHDIISTFYAINKYSTLTIIWSDDCFPWILFLNRYCYYKPSHIHCRRCKPIWNFSLVLMRKLKVVVTASAVIMFMSVIGSLRMTDLTFSSHLWDIHGSLE